MRRVPILLACLLLGGCSELPGGGGVPGVEAPAVRIAEGAGTSGVFEAELAVRRGNVVQLRVRIAEGEQAEIKIPDEPAREAEIAISADDGSSGSVVLTSAGGGPLALSRPSRISPGHVGVEQYEEDGQRVILVTAPRIMGAPQGQVDFRLELEAR